MKLQRTFLFVVLFLLSISVAFAIPPLPTEYYGAIYASNGLGLSGSAITLVTSNGTICGGSFTIQNTGYFGLVSCPGDDPDTVAVEGIPSGERIDVYYNGQPTVLLDGNNATSSGTFRFLNVTYPVPVCGDDICDSFLENISACPADCDFNITGNGTGNGTGGTGGTNSSGGSGGSGGTGTGSTSGGGTTGSSDTAAGGGGGGGGGGGSGQGAFSPTFPGAFPTAGFIPSSSSCQERWQCEEWEQCQPDGVQTRNCIDDNACGSIDSRPDIIRECTYIASCFNGIQDVDETDVDCGGSCLPCATCTNNIQDCHTTESGQILCETGVDCGGACRACNSCFNGIQDETEAGVDCGGQYCIACDRRPTINFPSFICEKSINPMTNAGLLFFLFLILFIALRTYFYLRKIDILHTTKALDDFARAKQYYAERRKLVLFILTALAVALLAYLYYYEFLLCQIGYEHLWWFLLLLIFFPFLIYEIWRYMEFHDKELLRGLGLVSQEHMHAMNRLLEVENTQIIELETELKKIIEQIAANAQLQKHFNEFSEIKTIYKDIIRLYYEYQTNKSPFGIEKDLCEQTYALETNDQFKNLAGKYPLFWSLFERLKLLYQHYERKQELYAQIDEESNRLKERAAAANAPVPGGDGGAQETSSEKKQEGEAESTPPSETSEEKKSE